MAQFRKGVSINWCRRLLSVHSNAWIALAIALSGLSAGSAKAQSQISPPRILITFPAAVDPAAAQEVERVHKLGWIGCGFLLGCTSQPDTLKELLFKTPFWANLLYRELSSRLPPGAVALQPRVVTVLANGDIAYDAGTLEPPHDYQIDLQAFVYPLHYNVSSRGDDPTTYGKAFLPLIVVSKKLDNGTSQIIAATKMMRPMSGSVSSATTFQVLQKHDKKRKIDPKIKPINYYWMSWNGQFDDFVDGKLATQSPKPIVDLATAILKAIPPASPSADRSSLLQYARLYKDVRCDLTEDQLAFISRFRTAEASFLYGLSETFSKPLTTGDYPSAYRELMKSEAKANSKALLGTFVQIMTLSAASAMPGMSNTDTIVTAMQQIEKIDLSAYSSAIDKNFQGLIGRQVEIAGDESRSQSVVVAQTLVQLREEFRNIFNTAFEAGQVPSC